MPREARASMRRASDDPGGLTDRQRDILSFIHEHVSDRGYPPSVREIGEAVGLSSPSTVHSHLRSLQEKGYLRTDPTKPRTNELRWDPGSGALAERQPGRNGPPVGPIPAGAPPPAPAHTDEAFP